MVVGHFRLFLRVSRTGHLPVPDEEGRMGNRVDCLLVDW